MDEAAIVRSGYACSVSCASRLLHHLHRYVYQRTDFTWAGIYPLSELPMSRKECVASHETPGTGSPPSDVGMVSAQGNTNRKESEMQTLASEQFKQRDRIRGIAIQMSRTAFFLALVALAPYSIGDDNQGSDPGKSTPVPTQAENARNGASDPEHGPRIGPASPTCAQLGTIGTTRQIERPLANGDLVGCGVSSNLA